MLRSQSANIPALLLLLGHKFGMMYDYYSHLLGHIQSDTNHISRGKAWDIMVRVFRVQGKHYNISLKEEHNYQHVLVIIF